MKRPMPLHRHLCFLDVGHGNSTLIIAGEDSVVVVDTGKQSSLSEFFLEQGITHVQSIYLSHADADHIGGLVGILATQKVSINYVYVNSDASKKSKVWDDLVYELDCAHNNIGRLEFKTELVSGHREKLPGDVLVEVLGPSRYLVTKGAGNTNRSGNRIRTNSISAVIAISVGSCRVALLPGDIDGVGLDDLFQNLQQGLHSKILVYPHHGGFAGTGTALNEQAKKLLSKVEPDIIIFSIGRGMYSTPNPDMVEQLRQLLPETRIACTQLSEHCADQLPSVAPTHLSEAFAAGREHGACCSGTVVVPLDNISAVQPQKIPHIKFIQDHAPTSLCLDHPPKKSTTMSNLR